MPQMPLPSPSITEFQSEPMAEKYYYFLRWSLTLLPRLECSSASLADSNLCLLGSDDSPTSVSQVAGITGIYHHTQLIFAFLVEMEYHHIGQIGLELLASSDPPALASECWVTGVSHCVWLFFLRDRVSFCCVGWSTVARAQPQTHGLKQSSCLSLPKCWYYRREPPHSIQFYFF